MVAPVVVPRSQHPLSRRDIDADALKVLYRLKDASYLAYLVGGSVRDLLLGRRPKDFDVGTSAHPYQVKRLFRNCWIIGRRFRLAHVRFGQKVIEVATFRRHVPMPETPEEDPIDDTGAGNGSARGIQRVAARFRQGCLPEGIEVGGLGASGAIGLQLFEWHVDEGHSVLL